MDEQVRRWAEIAGIPLSEVSSEDDLFGLFQRYRPDGRRVEALFDGVARGEDILRRLLRCYAITASGYRESDAYFIPRDVSCGRELGLRLVRCHLRSMEEIAVTMKDTEVVEMLTKVTFKASTSKDDRQAILTSDGPDVWLCDLATEYVGTLRPVESSALLLREAFYSIASDLFIRDYLLWPLYEESSTLCDPFLSYFEMWAKGVSYDFASTELCLVYIPS